MYRKPVVMAVMAIVCSMVAVERGVAYEIGHLSRAFFDSSRNRNIDVEIFYPAATAGDDVPVAVGVFPVIAFGHGYTIPWSDYEYCWERLSAGGYIFCLSDTESGLLPDHLDFGRDLAFILGAMQAAGGAPGDVFYQHVASASALMGHSMGGGACFLGAQYATGLTTLVNLAAAETNPSAV
ncbi:hypothetical protein JW905_07315, partial [bacterium]|nr:hypothetical protein [candidate division CSSED10-310 bacterium]